ncbi:MAG: glycosyltransferase [bacterium]|nr:glycosyltransferase [bacterium]
MKIVISTDIYYPMINGVAVFSRNLAAGLTKRGHDVLVLAPSISGDFESEYDEEYGFKVVRLSSKKMMLYPDQINKVPEKKDFLGMKMPQLLYKNGLHVSYMPDLEIKRVLSEFQPDIIHNQTPGPVALAILRYARRHKVALVSTDHAYPDNLTQQVKLPELAKKPINAVMNAYFVSFLKRSDYATVPTEQVLTDCIPKSKLFFRVPIEALSNGIDLSRFAKGRVNHEIYERYDINPKKPTILYIGRVDPEKSLDVLMDAFVQVQKTIPEAQLVMVGDGTMRPKLEKMAENAGISDKVVFTGRVIGKDLPQLYRTGDVFAITSKTETQSIVLLEAMATGLPAVAVKAGAIPELVHNGRNGYLCEADDVDAVAKSLICILQDKNLRETMSEKSLELIKKHDISYTLTRIEEIYHRVLDEKKAHLDDYDESMDED